ncbi:MAG: hypothetical protein AAF802_05660 [Planctomycetota bacterium]
MKILTLQCEEASQLMSDSHDRKLLLTERLALRGHLLVCSVCPKLHSRLNLVVNAGRRRRGGEPIDQAAREIVQISPTPPPPSEVRMSDEMKTRLKQRLAKASAEDA